MEMSWLQDSKSAILRNQPTCCTYGLNPRLILTLALILPLSVGAYNPEHLKRLKQTKKCVVCELRDANLLGTHLKGAKLQKADLRGVILDGANLKGPTPNLLE